MHQVCSQAVQHTLVYVHSDTHKLVYVDTYTYTDSVQYVHTHMCELEMYGVLFDWCMCDAMHSVSLGFFH